MAFGASTETKLIRKNLPEFGLDVYSNIPTGELVVFVVQLLQDDGIPATVEEVVSACFRLFPHGFSLKNYFYWPDSALVARHLNNAKDNGYIKGNPAGGFALKVLGRQVAKQVAKSLGLPQLAPQKVKKPKPTEKKPELVKPSILQAKKKSAISMAEKSTAPLKEKKSPKKRGAVKKKASPKKASLKPAKPVKKVVSKKAKPEKASIALSPAPSKSKAAPKPKQKQKEKKKLPTPAPQKEKPLQKKVKPQQKRKTPDVQSAQQLSLPIPMAAKKEVKPAPARPKPAKKAITTIPARPKSGKAEKTAVIKKASAPTMPTPVSKEEKAKAGKALHMMERSDAHRQYKKHGGKAKISEFDFRNMLFATMESSAETLKRNVELFKRYAGIHNRQDLTIFLDYCEESFAPLLKSTKKKINRRKQPFAQLNKGV